MKLHTEVRGSGPELVLVHGWGVNSGVWQPIVPLLAKHYRVTSVDLPGHGASSKVSMPVSLAAVTQQVLEVAPSFAIWLGWSLGGLVCLQIAAHFSVRVRGLILSNTTPRFITAADWPHAMPPAQLDVFATELTLDFADTVRRFLALQVMGDQHARATLRALRDSVLSRGDPDAGSLAAGLSILRDSDLRDDLRHITAPTLVMAGAYDRVTPSQAGEFMASAIKDAEFICLPRAAHAPFISHSLDFVQALNTFTGRKIPGPVHEYAN
ncbi:MAG TPA: pimeloyl-ACP methyl ester esterase BioH [Gammaproteobacteria bacterium]|jgi:pimeloyl-[acyl-carrier protein] methyl ester esterase|nr:pimeloyl-ACP methyl ester esterase BioH [Gammaproteobacteria bacterium]